MSEPLIGIRRISPDTWWFVSWLESGPALRMGRGVSFQPGEPTMAKCRTEISSNPFTLKNEYSQGDHFSPHPECMCGIYAFSWEHMQGYNRPKSTNEMHTLAVLGWGVTFIGESGSVWRAQYAQPLAIVRYPPTASGDLPYELDAVRVPLRELYIDYRDLRDTTEWVSEVSERYEIPVVDEEAFAAWAHRYGQLDITGGDEYEGEERTAPGDYSDKEAWYT